MYKNEGYMAGTNLGHWISQYGNKSHEHFREYIKEKDLARIASWGMDHVRLPVDYFIFERDENPGAYLENGLCYIDNCLEWCKKYKLNMVLDMHHAPGFFFSKGDENKLMEDPETQERYISIWRFLSKRYAREKDNLAFELLNELVAETSELWNILWPRAAEAIHEISPHRKVIVGSNKWNSADELKNLLISPNPNILYTFHMYSPFIFTHQKAGWVEQTRRYIKQVDYPVNTDEHIDFYQGNIPEHEKGILDKEYLQRVIAPAVDFIEKNKRPLYCGEYGVISHASVPSAIAWVNDAADVFLEHGIGRAFWSYRGFAGLTDTNNEIVDIEYVKAVSRY